MDASIPVLIVGGGPIGLGLAADLGRRNIRTLLIEQNEDSVGSAKMIEVSVRTMESAASSDCRRLSVTGDFRTTTASTAPLSRTCRATSLAASRVTRWWTSRILRTVPSATGHVRRRGFDPILKRCAEGFPCVTMRYCTRLDRFVQDASGVSAEIVDVASGGRQQVRCQYLVGCDGYTSKVRSALGIEMRGEQHLDLSMSVYVRIVDLGQYHDKAQAYRYVFTGPEGAWAVLTTIDGRDLYRLQLIGVPDSDLNSVDLPAMLRRCVGRDFPFTIEDVSFWVRKMVVADRFMDGRVFLAGDSAHAHPPNGGLGMNTGMQDAFDLGWKLAATLDGWGGPVLLESYDYERRPTSSRAAVESLKNFRRLTANTSYPDIAADTPAGEALRRMLGRRLVEENEKSWHPVGVHLGYIYNPSPIVVPDGTVRPPDDTVGYIPSAFPGARAPHFWIGKSRSVLDLFGDGFTLLKFDDVASRALEVAFADHAVPLRVELINSRKGADLYECPLILVRPDGHVAWRGHRAPADPSVVADTVRGAGPRIAACRA